MESLSSYKRSHLVVAAIRVLSYLEEKPPSVGDVARLLRVSSEQVNMVCRKLEERGVIEAVEGPYGTGLFVRDHLAIEEFSRKPPKSGIEEELAKFRQEQMEREKRIEEIRQREEERKKKLFEQLNQGLKQGRPDKP